MILSHEPFFYFFTQLNLEPRRNHNGTFWPISHTIIHLPHLPNPTLAHTCHSNSANFSLSALVTRHLPPVTWPASRLATQTPKPHEMIHISTIPLDETLAAPLPVREKKVAGNNKKCLAQDRAPGASLLITAIASVQDSWLYAWSIIFATLLMEVWTHGTPSLIAALLAIVLFGFGPSFGLVCVNYFHGEFSPTQKILQSDPFKPIF